MAKVVEITLLIVVPLVFGLAVDFVFEWVRRRRNPGKNSAAEPSGHDWII